MASEDQASGHSCMIKTAIGDVLTNSTHKPVQESVWPSLEFDDVEFHYPGEHRFDGDVYHGFFPRDILVKIKSDLLLSPHDVVLSSYPKSGTTWMEEIIYMIQNGAEAADMRTEVLDDLFPHMEGSVPGFKPFYDVITSTEPPRNIKTHLPVHFFERILKDTSTCPKFIYIARNPKDSLVSFYHFHKIVTPFRFKRSWNSFFDLFREDRILYGRSTDHIVGWWKHKGHPNILFLKYEDMLDDPQKAIRQVCDHLGVDLSDRVIAEIQNGASFSAMSKRGVAKYQRGAAQLYDEHDTPFFRKGVRGDWKIYFNEEQSAFVDEQKDKLWKDIGMEIPE